MSNVASTGSGGGIYVSSSAMAISGTVFKENRGATGGGWSSHILERRDKLDRVGGLKIEQYLRVALSAYHHPVREKTLSRRERRSKSASYSRFFTQILVEFATPVDLEAIISKVILIFILSRENILVMMTNSRCCLFFFWLYIGRGIRWYRPHI